MTNLALHFPESGTAAPRFARLGLPTFANGFRFVMGAIGDARRCRADRDIERLIQQNGGVLSDEVERRISRLLGA